jgi:hypothetical protein
MNESNHLWDLKEMGRKRWDRSEGAVMWGCGLDSSGSDWWPVNTVMKEVYGLPKCDAMQSGRQLSTFQRILLLTSSGRRVSQARKEFAVEVEMPMAVLRPAPSAHPCHLGIEPCLGSWPHCNVQNDTWVLLTWCLLSERKRVSTCRGV